MRKALVLAALTLAVPAFAGDDLDPEKAAKIERDTEKALEKVDQKWGNKKPSQLTSDERKQVIADRAAAEREVFEKHNVDAKTYTKYTSRQTKEERAATKEAGQRILQQEKADAAKKDEEKKQPGGPKEIIIQRGGAGKDPIIMEEKDGAAPIVEKGLPQEAQDEQADATAMTDSSTETNPNAPAPAPAKGGGKGGAKKGK